MTFNIRHGKGLDGKVNLERIVDVIHSKNIDIVSLNEVDQAFSIRSHYVDQGHWLARKLEMNYIFGPSLSSKGGHYGNAILSRLPITKYDNHIFRIKPLLAEPRAILEASICVKNIEIKVLATHFSIHPTLHRKQLHFCQTYPNTVPCIIMGDFNRKPSSYTYNRLTEKYLDCSATQPLPTFPAKKPRLRLDYIFISNHFQVLDTTVIQTNASDHLPVFTQLAFK